jgi:hypothetical protein
VDAMTFACVCAPAHPPDRARSPRAEPGRRLLLPIGGSGPALGQEPPQAAGPTPRSRPDSLIPRGPIFSSRSTSSDSLRPPGLASTRRVGRAGAESWSVEGWQGGTFVIRRARRRWHPVDAEAASRWTATSRSPGAQRGSRPGPEDRGRGNGSGVADHERPSRRCSPRSTSRTWGSPKTAEKAGELRRRPVGRSRHPEGLEVLMPCSRATRATRTSGDVENRRAVPRRVADLDRQGRGCGWRPRDRPAAHVVGRSRRPRIEKDARSRSSVAPRGSPHLPGVTPRSRPSTARAEGPSPIRGLEGILDASYLYGTVIQAAPAGAGLLRRGRPAVRLWRDEAKAASSRRRATRRPPTEARDGAGKPVKITLTTWVALRFPGGPGHPGGSPGRRWRRATDRRGRLPRCCPRASTISIDADDLPDRTGSAGW